MASSSDDVSQLADASWDHSAIRGVGSSLEPRFVVMLGGAGHFAKL